MKKLLSRTVLAAVAVVFAAGLAWTGSATAGFPSLDRLPDGKMFKPVFWGFGGGDEKEKQQVATKEYEIHDDEAFKEQTRSYGMMPFSKAELEYEIYIPKNWTEAELIDATPEQGTRNTIVSKLALYKSPMIGTVWIETQIDAKKLDHEISAKYWLKNYILSSGFTPDGDVEELSLKSAAGRYIATGRPAAPSSSEYVTARISGGWILLSTCRLPLPLRNYAKYIQKKICDSFKIIYPKAEPIEDQKIFTLVDSIKFTYPNSWSVKATDFRNMNRLVVHIENKGFNINIEGFMSFVAVRRSRSTDLTTEIIEQRKYFDEVLNLDVVKMLSSSKGPVYDRFNFNRYEVYDMAQQKNKDAIQEVHMIALGDKEWYVFGYLFTPKESSNLYNWARNVQTFQEVMKSIK